MKTIKIKTTETVVTEKEVQLPYFCKDGEVYFYKLSTEERGINVLNGEKYFGIFTCPAKDVAKPNLVEITEEEFEDKYAEILTKINDLKNVIC